MAQKGREMKNKLCNFFVILGIMFVSSMIMLGILTLLVWKMDGGSNVLCIGIILTYILSNILGGFLVGKLMGKQKFFWGVVIGTIYFLVLLVAGVFIMKIKVSGNMQLISGAMMCIISGMLGGMIAPGEKSA